MSNNLEGNIIKLGEHIKHIKDTTDRSDERVGVIHEVVIRQDERIKHAHERLDNAEAVLKDYVETKNKGIGFLAALCTLSGGVGAAFAKAIGHF